MKNRRLLLIDGNNLAFRTFLKMPNLTSNGKNTSVLYGFLRKIAELSLKYIPYKMAVVFDRKESYRKELNKSYKAKRVPIPNVEVVYDAIAELKTILPKISIPVFCIKYFEADDVLAHLALNNKTGNTIICSSDKDMLQCIDSDVIIHNWKEDITEKVFKDRFGFDSCLYSYYKSLVGDCSDNIKGVKGIGAKTAFDIIVKTDGSLKKIKTVLGKEKYAEFLNALELVLIPYVNGDYKLLNDLRIQKYDPSKDAIMDVMSDYNIVSITWKSFYSPLYH
jgi:DNA polymerase I